MNVLVTGGAGFIGSHLCENFLERGERVTVLDDLSTGSSENIASYLDDPRFTFVRGSITDDALVQRLVDKNDAVYHAAAALGMRLVVGAPLRTLTTNIAGTQIVLAAAAAGKKRTIFVSTSEVYGLNPAMPVAETAAGVLGSPLKGRWSYAYSKAAGEAYAAAYHREKQLPVTVVRLFNTVGPRQTGRYGMVVPTFVRQALAGEPLTVHGDGSQTRCFTHVFEIARGLAALLYEPRSIGEAFNLGSAREIAIRDLAQLTIDLTGSRSTITYVPFEQAYEPGFEEIQRRIPDIAKARALIGFDPKRTLADTIRDVIAEEQKRLVAL